MVIKGFNSLVINRLDDFCDSDKHHCSTHEHRQASTVHDQPAENCGFSCCCTVRPRTSPWEAAGMVPRQGRWSSLFWQQEATPASSNLVSRPSRAGTRLLAASAMSRTSSAVLRSRGAAHLDHFGKGRRPPLHDGLLWGWLEEDEPFTVLLLNSQHGCLEVIQSVDATHLEE